MALVSDRRALRSRVLADLEQAHDYYVHTKAAWAFIEKAVAGRRRFTIRNPATGTTTSHSELVRKSTGYVAEQLAQSTFQQFLAIFEGFLFDLLRLWLTEYPQSLLGKKVDFALILDAPDKEAIVQLAIGKELTEILYDRPQGWFAYIEQRATRLPEPGRDRPHRGSQDDPRRARS
jgi:hypothetical protein